MRKREPMFLQAVGGPTTTLFAHTRRVYTRALTPDVLYCLKAPKKSYFPKRFNF